MLGRASLPPEGRRRDALLRLVKARLRHLSLFTGYGGFELGLGLAGVDFRTVGYVEIDDYCQRIIQARIRDGLLDWAPIVRDVRRADFRRLAGMVDLITAGFPCQPHSVAGGRLGSSDQRNLWPDTLRAIRRIVQSSVSARSKEHGSPMTLGNLHAKSARRNAL